MSKTGLFRAVISGDHLLRGYDTNGDSHVCDLHIWERGKPWDGYTSPETQQVEARGYDGSLGNGTVYLLDCVGITPVTFRWSDDLARRQKESPEPFRRSTRSQAMAMIRG